jgi:PEGA domain
VTISHAAATSPRNPTWGPSSEIASDALLEFTSELDLLDLEEPPAHPPSEVVRFVLADAPALATPRAVARPRLQVTTTRSGQRSARRSRLTTEWRVQYPAPRMWPVIGGNLVPARVASAARRIVTSQWRMTPSRVWRVALSVSFVSGLVLGGVAMSLVAGRADTSPASSGFKRAESGPAAYPPLTASFTTQLARPDSQATGERTAASASSALRVTGSNGTVADGDRDAPTPGARSAVYRGSLLLDSRPRGARVYMNGRDIGVTPLDLKNLAVGSRAVRLELDGYQSWSSAIQISTNQRSNVTATLSPDSPLPASVRFELNGSDLRAPLPFVDISRP